MAGNALTAWELIRFPWCEKVYVYPLKLVRLNVGPLRCTTKMQ